MFENFDENIRMLQGAYRKLKGYYYYNKTMLFMRKLISDFEWNDTIVDTTFRDLALLLKNPKNTKSTTYIERLISNIDFAILPKSFADDALENEDFVLNGTRRNKELREVNFFIKPPIELLILDTLWTTILGKIGYDNRTIPQHSYGNIPRYSRLYKNDIDFYSSSLFEYYAYKYSNWRDNAFNEIKRNYRKNKNSILISLDLKSYYYSCDFQFSQIKNLFGEHVLFNKIKSLTNIISKAYIHYSNIISPFRKDIKNNVIFPIGLLSSLILSVYYLKTFDNTTVKRLKTKYYGRYVDDILIVLESDINDSINKEKLLNELMIESGLLKKKRKELCLVLHPNLKIQTSKINLFLISTKKSKSITEIYNQMIRIRPSQENILPDFQIKNLSFNEHAYYFSNVMKNKNLEELRFIKTDNFNAINYITSITKLSKNINSISKEREKIIRKKCKEILEYYSGFHSLEYANAWLWIFDYLIINKKEKINGNKFYKRVINQIKNLSITKIDNIDNRKRIKVSDIVRKSLQEELLVAVSTAIALNVDNYNNLKVQTMAKKIRKANMFNDKLCSIPLLNYSSYSDNNFSLLELDINKIKKTSKTSTLKLNTRKIHFAPRFIQLNELFQYYFVRDYEHGGNIFNKRIHKLINDYKKYNFINDNLGILEEESVPFNNNIVTQMINIDNYNIKYKNPEKLKIAIVSVPINNEWCKNPLGDTNLNVTYENKLRLYKLLHNALAEKVHYRVYM